MWDGRMMEREDVGREKKKLESERGGPEGRRHTALDAFEIYLMNKETLKSNSYSVGHCCWRRRTGGSWSRMETQEAGSERLYVSLSREKKH